MWEPTLATTARAIITSCYCLRFTDEQTEAQKLGNFPEPLNIVSIGLLLKGRIRILKNLKTEHISNNTSRNS